MVDVVGAVNALHSDRIEVIRVGAHHHIAHIASGELVYGGFVAHIAHAGKQVLVFTGNHEVAIAIAHATGDKGGVDR